MSHYCAIAEARSLMPCMVQCEDCYKYDVVDNCDHEWRRPVAGEPLEVGGICTKCHYPADAIDQAIQHAGGGKA